MRVGIGDSELWWHVNGTGQVGRAGGDCRCGQGNVGVLGVGR